MKINVGYIGQGNYYGDFFNLDVVKQEINNNPEDKEIILNITSAGGEVETAIQVHEYLRSLSGYTIKANVFSSCHSAAIIIALAASKENRLATPYATALIHEVRTFTYGTVTTTQAESLAVMLDIAQDNILNIYAERLDINKERCEELMKQEQELNTQQMLDIGLIDGIIPLINNCKPNNNNNKMGFFNTKQKEEQKFNTVDGGNFVTSALEVGATAKPNGVFNLEDGKEVIISNGKIDSINEKEVVTNSTFQKEATDAINSLIDRVTELTDKVAVLTNIAEATPQNAALKRLVNQVTSAPEANPISGQNGGNPCYTSEYCKAMDKLD